MRDVLSKALKGIKPSKDDERFARKLISDVFSESKLSGLILGGSVAKGTWLRGTHDFDIFVASLKPDSNKLHSSLKKRFKKVNRVHGSRDYFQVYYNEYTFEFVPVKKISYASKAENITDVSPLHISWVKKNVFDKDSVRLAKAFCQANKCYGAESYIGGFSGYVLEILIAYYGSFQRLLKASQNWRNREVIDIRPWYKSNIQVMNTLNTSKLQSSLIIIDPVDKNRNAAAALSDEKLKLFQKVAKRFLNRPSKSYFVRKIVDKSKFKGYLVLNVTPLDGKRDVVGAKLLSSYKYFLKNLKEFGVTKSGWEWNNSAFFYFKTKKDVLSKTFFRNGPPKRFEEAVKAFKKKHEVVMKNGRIFAKIKREKTKIRDVVKEIIKNSYIKERVRRIRIERFINKK